MIRLPARSSYVQSVSYLASDDLLATRLLYLQNPCRHLSSRATAGQPKASPVIGFGRAIEDDYAIIRSKYGQTPLYSRKWTIADEPIKQPPKIRLS